MEYDCQESLSVANKENPILKDNRRFSQNNRLKPNSYKRCIPNIQYKRGICIGKCLNNSLLQSADTNLLLVIKHTLYYFSKFLLMKNTILLIPSNRQSAFRFIKVIAVFIICAIVFIIAMDTMIQIMSFDNSCCINHGFMRLQIILLDNTS